MKHLALFILLFGFGLNLFAQYEPTYKPASSSDETKPMKAYYAGFGTSVFGKYGFLGGSFGARFAPKTIGEVNFGLGGWGSKIGFAASTNVTNKNTWCPSIGFSRNSGIQGGQLPVEVVSNTGTEYSVTTGINLDPINVIHLGMQRQFISKKGGRFVLELGYSLTVSKTTYSFSDKDFTYNNTLVPTSQVTFSDTQKALFKAQNPGGIMLNFSYLFGFGNYN